MEAFIATLKLMGLHEHANQARASVKAKSMGNRNLANSLLQQLASSLNTVSPHLDVGASLADLGVSNGPKALPHATIIRVVAPRVIAEFQTKSIRGRRWMDSWGTDLLIRKQTSATTIASGWSKLQNLAAWTRAEPHAVEPNKKLSIHLEKWFEFTLHELPSGVLCGMNGATTEQCAELMNWTDAYTTAISVLGGPSPAQKELLKKCRYHYTAYAKYRSTRKPEDTYQSFLHQTDSDSTTKP